MHLFFQIDPSKTELDDEESRHILKVLRLRTDDIIYITDGKGLLQKCCIQYQGKKVQYKVLEQISQKDDKPTLTMVVAPTRKAERNEWMVEKMTEIGVRHIIFVVTTHTHKEGLNRVVNMGRLQRIAASAMKQSQQYFLPEISLENSFDHFLEQPFDGTKLIAYVPVQHDTKHAFEFVQKQKNTMVLIGPEGDFTEEEVGKASANGYLPASLGPTRLRTETAAVAACHAVNLAYQVHS